MATFPFLQGGNLGDYARQLTLSTYQPSLTLKGLMTGVDNVRSDVFLSTKFSETARMHMDRLMMTYGSVEDFAEEPIVWPPRPPSVLLWPNKPPPPSPSDSAT